MSEQGFTRRDFQRLALMALGGMAAGCQPANKPEANPPAEDQAAGHDQAAAESGKPDAALAKANDVNPLLVEPHVCRGLNTCKGFGSDTCAGLSQCASKEVHHTCGGNNDCRGQGGCGTNSGENACKGQGGCHVPLMEEVWGKTRQRFEELMKQAGRKFGPAPAPAES